MYLKKTILRALFLLLTAFTIAQQQEQISFNQLSVEDGLSQNSVISIAQDSIGYLWFATQDGLNKYSGESFDYFPKFFEDITNDYRSKLGKIYIGPSQDMYIITLPGQLEKYDPTTNSFATISRFKNPSAILENDKLWIGTYGNGLFAASNNDTTAILKPQDSSFHVFDIIDNNSTIWAAGSGKVLAINNDTLEYSTIDTNKAETINYSSIVASDTSATVWVGSFGYGLFKNDKKNEKLVQFTGFSAEEQLPINLNIEDLLIDSKNRLWIATYGNGAYLIDLSEEKIQHFTPQEIYPNSLEYEDVLCIYEDFAGTIWLGTDGAGIFYFDEHLFKFNIMLNEHVPLFANVDVTRAIAVDDNSGLWIGTSGKGLTVYDQKRQKFNTYRNNPKDAKSIPSDRIVSLLHENKQLWVGFQDRGLSILQNKKFTNYTYETTPTLPANTVWCIISGDNKMKWLGTRENGLVLFDEIKGVQKQYKYEAANSNSISSNNVRTIAKQNDAIFWIGTEENGLNKFLVDEGSFIRYQQPEIKNIKSIYVQENIVWVGTNGNGLQGLDISTNKLYSYTTEDGLPNNVIYGILPDAQGNLWLSSNKGLTRFRVDTLGEKPEITNYDTSDGLQAREFNTGAYYKAANGTLYFGGLNGINWFHPNDLSKNLIPPKTVLSSIELFNKPFSFGEVTDFNYKENTLSFTFSGLHYSQPERNQFKYILEGYDENWSLPTDYNVAHYTNLSSGAYTFKVLSSNYDGTWDKSPAMYQFTIHPPWYLTNWAFQLYAILLLLMIYAGYTYLKWRWNMQLKLQVEHDETERLKKLDELKSKLYTNISHEFRTPLTLITAPVQQLLNEAQFQENDKKKLEIVASNSERMLQLVNQLLDLSKLESGTVTPSIKSHNLKAHLVQLTEAFSHVAKREDRIVTSQFKEISFAAYDKDILEKIVTNLLSNAVKYSPPESSIHFSAEMRNNVLYIDVANENRALKENELSRIFQRFYQVSPTSEGIGVGLSLVKELTNFSKGTIKAERLDAENIVFALTLPMEANIQPQDSNVAKTNAVAFKKGFISEENMPEKTALPLLLIVEDNPEILSYLTSIFSEAYQVITAINGAIGIEKAIEAVPDVIISDVMMPLKDGIELCNTLKTDMRTSHIPIILLTAKVAHQDELVGLQNKADHYITKPFHADIVMQTVANCIEQQQRLQEKYSEYVFLKPKEIATNSADERFLQQLQTIIDSKITDGNYNASKFSEDMGLSRMQLHRKLNALTGLNTTEFMRSQRLKSAENLLNTTNLTISEIAYSVGFNTPSYFIKCFKEAYKITPTNYQKSKL